MAGGGSISPATGANLTVGANSSAGTFQYGSSASSKFAAISVGNGTGAAGTLNQTAGTINAQTLTLSGVYSGGNGNVTLGNASGAAATMIVSGNVDVSAASSGNVSTLTVQNTGLLAINGSLEFGDYFGSTNRSAYGVVNQTGGTVSAASLNLAYDVSTGTSAHSGTYNLNGGLLELGSIAIGTATNGGTLAGTFNLSGGTLQATGDNANFWANSTSTTAALAGTGATIDDGGHAITIAQVLSGLGALTKADTGILTLSGSNTYAGITTISGGTLQIGGSGRAGQRLLWPGHQQQRRIGLQHQQQPDAQRADLRDRQSHAERAWACWRWPRSNAYGGGTTVSAGTLQLNALNALGSGVLTVNGGLVDLHGNDLTFANNNALPSLSGTGGVITDFSTHPNVTLTVNQAVNTTFAGALENGSTCAVALKKYGAGTLTLGGSSNYSAGTFVYGGVLQLGNSAALGTGA